MYRVLLPASLAALICLCACPQELERACGASAQPCCEGKACNTGLECGADKTCHACGGRDELCCGGLCSQGLSCEAGSCRCVGESDEALCASLGKDCGEVQATDGCGTTRTLDCGDCSPPMTCGGGGTANVCGSNICVPESDAELCGRIGADCAEVTSFDNCERSRTVNCGDCEPPLVCGMRSANVCECPETDSELCARLRLNCGEVSATDTCGLARTVASCGECESPLVCGGSGRPNVCACEQTDAELCAQFEIECGETDIHDRCGELRAVSCPECPAPLVCGGSGSANTCEPGWQLVEVPTTTALSAVWGSSADDVWVGGWQLLLHWDGSAWSKVLDLPRIMIAHLWGAAPDDLWAGGYVVDESATVLLHWDGSRWSWAETPLNVELRGVWGWSSTDVWAVGGSYPNATLLHWNGDSWSQRAAPAGAKPLTAVWGSAPDDVWAVGYSGTLLHWDGWSWSAVANPALHDLLGIWGSAHDDVWAVGYSGTLLHWDGRSWRAVPSSSGLEAVWGSAANDIWAVGWNGHIRHWDGARWLKATSPTTKLLTTLWGLSANEVWAVGEQGAVLRRRY